MKPPKMVYVGPHDVEVKHTKFADRPTLLGEFDGGDTAIFLRSDQSPGSLRDTVLHELVHAIFYLSGAAVAMGISQDDEERLNVLLTPWLLALLRDNPKLVDFLMENREREY